jgi:hypothetical protein
MPDEEIQERRSKRNGGTYQTQLLIAYKRLPAEDKRRFSKLGMMGLVFFGGLPMMGQMILKVLERPGIGWPYWVFSGVGFLVSLLIFWPPAGIHALSAIPSGIAKILPKGLKLSRVDQRSSPPLDE